jgi:hypothetical protein
MISDGTVFATVITLGQYGARGIIGGVYIKVVGVRGIRLGEVGIVKEDINEGVQGLSTLVRPAKCDILLSEFGEGTSKMGVVWYKRSLITKYAQDSAYVSDGM